MSTASRWFKNPDGKNPVKASLMISSKGHDHPGPLNPYRDYWNMLKAAVKELVPVLNDNKLWEEIKYKRLNTDGPRLEDTAAGKLVSKYDLKHELEG